MYGKMINLNKFHDVVLGFVLRNEYENYVYMIL
jgi:hypothetical protein